MTEQNCRDLECLSQYLLFGQDGNCFSCVYKQTSNYLNIQCVENLLANGKGCEVVTEVSNSCHRYAVDCHVRPAVLAICARCGDPETKKAAYAALPTVCKRPKDLFVFIEFSQQQSGKNGGTGWGRAQRTAIRNWYETHNPKELVTVCTEQARYYGWSHKDVFRLAHLKTNNVGTAVVIRYLSKGLDSTWTQFAKPDASAEVTELLEYVKVIWALKHAKDEQEAAHLITTYNHLTFANVPNDLKKSLEVWRCLIPVISLSQLLLHLRRFTSMLFFVPNNGLLPLLLEQLRDVNKIASSKLHPIEVYVALKKYELLGKQCGNVSYKRPKPSIINALQNIMTISMKNANLSATGKRYLVAVDVRNPMVHGKVFGCEYLTPAVASALLFLPLFHAESHVTVVAFSVRGLKVLNLKSDMSLAQVTKLMRETPMGAVDCAKPMIWAQELKKLFDVFLILTDNKTKPAELKPVDAICQYRHAMDLPHAKLVICAFGQRKFNPDDAYDAGTLHIAGFNMHVPHVIREFILATTSLL